jgi:hypothetical protein
MMSLPQPYFSSALIAADHAGHPSAAQFCKPVSEAGQRRSECTVSCLEFEKENDNE